MQVGAGILAESVSLASVRHRIYQSRISPTLRHKELEYDMPAEMARIEDNDDRHYLNQCQLSEGILHKSRVLYTPEARHG